MQEARILIMDDEAQERRRLTAGHAVLMGRRTWESLPDPSVSEPPRLRPI